jgi:hypothetical protein
VKQLIIATTIAISSLTVHAEFVDGNKLFQWMNSSEEGEIALATGYIAGAFDAQSGVSICAPGNVTVQQVMDMVKVVLKKIPEQRHKSGDIFVSAVGQTNWPCKKQNQSRGTSL